MSIDRFQLASIYNSNHYIHMNKIKVSIIVPVHNTAPYVDACVESILRQTLEELEIILVENGSTDGSAEQCRRIVATDSRIKFIQIDKADLSTARNTGVKEARGEYIGFVDSDDTILPEMLSEMYAVAIENGLTMVSCNSMRKFDNGKIKIKYSQDGSLRIVTAKEATSMVLRGMIPVTVWSFLYHRSLFDKMQFPTDMYYEDRASTFRFVAEATKVGIINKAYYIYYQRKNSIMRSKKTFRKFRDYVITDILRFRFINESGMFPTSQEKADVAHKSADHLISNLFYLSIWNKTQAEKKEYKSLLKTLSIVPPKTKLSLKQRLFLFTLIGKFGLS